MQKKINQFFVASLIFMLHSFAGSELAIAAKPGPSNTGPNNPGLIKDFKVQYPNKDYKITVDGTTLENFSHSGYFEIAADTVKMKRAMSFNRGDNRQSQSSSPDEIELTIQAAEKEDHTFETVDTDDEEDDDQNNKV